MIETEQISIPHTHQSSTTMTDQPGANPGTDQLDTAISRLALSDKDKDEEATSDPAAHHPRAVSRRHAPPSSHSTPYRLRPRSYYLR